jgi:hypothetical protein
LGYSANGKEKLPCFLCGEPIRKGEAKTWQRVRGLPKGATDAHQRCFDNTSLTPRERAEKVRLIAAQRDRPCQQQLPLETAGSEERCGASAAEQRESSVASVLRLLSGMNSPASMVIAPDGVMTVTFPGAKAA